MSHERGIISTHASGVDLVIEWKIKNFFTLPKRDGYYYYSPDFCFGGEGWDLGICPNGLSRRDSSGHVDLRLWKKNSNCSIMQSFSLSLKTVKGGKYNELHCTKDFGTTFRENCYDLLWFIPRSELSRKRSELVPGGMLTVVCTMKNTTSATSDTGKSIEENSQNTCVKACTQTEEENAEKSLEENSQNSCVEACTQTEEENEEKSLEENPKNTCVETCTQTEKENEEKSLEENPKNTCVETCTQTEKENDYNWPEKLLMVLCIASILIAVVTGCALAYSEIPLLSSHPCGEAVKKIQTSENNKADNRSDVVGSKEFEASSSNETSTTDIKKWGMNKTLAAEMNKIDKSEIAGSDIIEASAAIRIETDESEPLPQPVLMVTEVGSTYLEVAWVLPDESKTNAARIHYLVLFRKCETQWQEVSFLNASRTYYSLTNLNPGMSYQIYVMALDSRFSRPSEIATVRTSDKAVNHNLSKGHGKQLLVYAATIIILVIAIACVYYYSKTSFSALHPYGEEDNNIKADLSEVAETDELQASDSKTCATETEGPVTFNNALEDFGFVSDINRLLKENRVVDVTFELETSNGETKLFAHQLILAVMSSYFAEEFYDKGRNKAPQVIPLKGINPKAFEQMIRYCYGENPIFETTEEVCALFKVAFEFKVISLQNLCHTFFRHTKIEPGNVFRILKISVEMEDKNLQDMCYQILQEKTREVMAAYELCHITPAMVYTLLKLPKLSLNSEYDLIKWIFEWAKVKSEDAREHLERLLKDMNFLALRFEEFATLCKDYQGFFNSDEIASIYQNIAHAGTREMPEWFNNDLKCRVYTGSN